ncbi:MAG: winged helix DNA-binding domain-containing protein [Coriobacteriia bacterium]
MSHPVTDLLGDDVVEWLLASREPAAVFITLTRVLGRADDDRDVQFSRAAVLAEERVAHLVDALPRWGVDEFSGHDSPNFLPNLLGLLNDFGVREGDFPRVDEALDLLLAHQDSQGRFESYGRYRGGDARWGALLCDTHAITGALLRFGRGGDPRVAQALQRAAADLTDTPQGPAWRCEPDKRTLFRGPGRKADVCPQVTLEALRAFAYLPPESRPVAARRAARTPLEVWRRRADERPYMFGHGYQFKSVKWPNLWYDVLGVVDTIGRYPEVWSGPAADGSDRRALAELAACLIAYNTDDIGRVIPRRAYRGFEEFSFGQKKEPSPTATALVAAALTRLEGLADEIAAVDVTALGSSKGGSGSPVPPRGGAKRARKDPPVCPTPARAHTYPTSAVLPRLLTRHHLGTPWVLASAETVVADVVGLHATAPTAPYASLAARLPDFAPERLSGALFDRRSLTLFRCMRGALFVVRSEMLPALAAATGRAVAHHSARYLGNRGVTMRHYELLATSVLDALDADAPRSVFELRAALNPHADLGAVLTHMCNEGLVVRDRPAGGWTDRRYRYSRLDRALPGVDINALSEEDGTLILVRAYVRAFGPVRKPDIAWWTGAGVRRTDGALAALGDEIVEVRIDGEEELLLMHAADLDELESAAQVERPLVALLPALDPLLSGYTRRERFVDAAARPFVFDRAGHATSVIVVDGRVAGVWDTATRPASMQVHLFSDPDTAVRTAVDAAASRLGAMLFSGEVPVHWRRKMPPLGPRPGGSVAHPLRG